MKINLIGTLPDRDREMYRGPERTTIGLADALHDRGHDVTVWADEGHPTTVSTPARVLVPAAEPGIGRMLRFNQALSQHAFDGIVHAWRPVVTCDILSLHSVGMAEMMAKRFDVDWRTLVGAKLHRWAKNYTAVRASQTIVTAPGNVTQAASYGITPDGIVPVGAEQRFFQDDTYDGGVDVLSVGRVEPRKQVHFVCHETPEEYTTVVAGGESDSNYATQMTERWIGRVSETRLLNLYQQAGVFVLPSYFEGFGLTAVEAMAARTPVIVNDRMPIAEWVRKYDLGGVYWWDDSASYRRTLDDVLSHREYYADNAQQFAEEHLTWEEIAARYEAIYEYTKRPESVTSVPASFDTESPLHN